MPGAGLEPACLLARHFKCLVSTNSTTRASAAPSGCGRINSVLLHLAIANLCSGQVFLAARALRDSSSSLYTVRNGLRIRCPQGTLVRQQRRWQVYCLGSSSQSCLGNFPESRETHLRCIRCRPRGLNRTFYLPYDVGVDPAHFTQPKR